MRYNPPGAPRPERPLRILFLQDGGVARIHTYPGVPLRIVIDLTSLLPEATGCDVYTTQLVRHLGRADAVNTYVLCVNAEDRALFRGTHPPNFSILPISCRPRTARLAFQQALLPAAALLLRADVVHSPSFISPFLRLGRRQVLTVHDMTFFSLPEFHIPLRRSAAFKNFVLRSIRSSDAVLTPSAATRDHIRTIVPSVAADCLHVVPYGISPSFFVRSPEDTARESRRLNLPESYILAVGTIEPRKNLGRLIDSYLWLVENHQICEHLVIAGRLGWNYEDILAKLEAPALRGRVHRIGFVPAGDLPWYYAAAKVCAYPSIQEGFGFPPLEAMACGVPVVSSDSSSLAENLDGAAILAPPEDTRALAHALLRLISDPSLHARTREAGLARAARFSWDETARRTIEVYKRVAS